MKWLTAVQVEKYAITPIKALTISIKHWQQIVDATMIEIKDYNKGLFDSWLCGLCTYWSCYECDEKKESNCPLAKVDRCNKSDEGEGESQYDRVTGSYKHWEANFYKQSDFRVFKTEARKMLKLLKSLKEKE